MKSEMPATKEEKNTQMRKAHHLKQESAHQEKLLTECRKMMVDVSSEAEELGSFVATDPVDDWKTVLPTTLGRIVRSVPRSGSPPEVGGSLRDPVSRWSR